MINTVKRRLIYGNLRISPKTFLESMEISETRLVFASGRKSIETFSNLHKNHNRLKSVEFWKGLSKHMEINENLQTNYNQWESTEFAEMHEKSMKMCIIQCNMQKPLKQPKICKDVKKSVQST